MSQTARPPRSGVFFFGPKRTMVYSFTRFLDHTQRRITVSSSHRPTPNNTQNSQQRHPCPPGGFEPTIPAGERPETYVLDRAATGTGKKMSIYNTQINLLKSTGHVMYQQFNIQQQYVLPTLYLCVLCLSENKQRLVPLTALTDWFL